MCGADLSDLDPEEPKPDEKKGECRDRRGRRTEEKGGSKSG